MKTAPEAEFAAVQLPGAYQLFDLGRLRSVPLVVRSSSPQQLVLAAAKPLQSGRYSFVATHEGMFGGRDFAYLQIVPAGAPVTAISSRPRATAPAVIDALLPLCAALVALTFAALLLRSFRRRPSGEKVLWALGFVLFGLAAACEATAQRAGWSPGLFRTYYLAGGVLTVAYLGAGSAWLLLPKRGRDALLGGSVVPAGAVERLDRRRRARRSARHRALTRRLVQLRLRRGAAGDRLDVQRLRLRRSRSGRAARGARAAPPAPR